MLWVPAPGSGTRPRTPTRLRSASRASSPRSAPADHNRRVSPAAAAALAGVRSAVQHAKGCGMCGMPRAVACAARLARSRSCKPLTVSPAARRSRSTGRPGTACSRPSRPARPSRRTSWSGRGTPRRAPFGSGRTSPAKAGQPAFSCCGCSAECTAAALRATTPAADGPQRDQRDGQQHLSTLHARHLFGLSRRTCGQRFAV